MKKGKLKSLICVIMCSLLLISVTLICINASRVYAAPEIGTPENEEPVSEDSEGDIEPYAAAYLSLSIDCGEGKVWATAKNTFTWYYSTVIVILLLYSSDTYMESYTDMTLVSSNQTGDLDMGKTITTEASTGGVEKYWLARMRYKINSGEWKSKDTGVCRISGAGEFLGFV